MNPAPRNFDEFLQMASTQMPNVMNWREFWLEGGCAEDRGGRGGRGGKGKKGGKGGKGKRGGGDGMIDWSENKDRIIMTGADGSKLYIEMGATKVAVSAAATVAAMTLW